MGMGGAGCITATSNLVADSLATVFWHHADPARQDAVQAAQTRINAFRDLSNSYVQIPAIKAMVAFRHGQTLWTRTRPPLVGLSPVELDTLKDRLRAIGATVKDLSA
jgi:4-hydroxy-tetrahydrodipicolinate synthase